MRVRPASVGAGLAAVFLMAAPAWAGPLEDAATANSKGDYTTAMGLARPLAEQGDHDAQVMVGIMYALGRGVVANEATAASWWKRAGDIGYGQYGAGLVLVQGVGGPIDEKAALGWFEKSASSGFWASELMAAAMYQNGKGAPKNLDKAYHWYQRAAEDGAVAGQVATAGLATADNRSTRDLVEGYKWLRVLQVRCQKNEVPAPQGEANPAYCGKFGQTLELVGREMTQEQVATANHQAYQWLGGDHPQRRSR
jgi:TPR repeat protein